MSYLLATETPTEMKHPPEKRPTSWNVLSSLTERVGYHVGWQQKRLQSRNTHLRLTSWNVLGSLTERVWSNASAGNKNAFSDGTPS